MKKFFVRDIESLIHLAKEYGNKNFSTSSTLENLLVATLEYAQLTGKETSKEFLDDFRKRGGVFVIIRENGSFDFTNDSSNCLGIAFVSDGNLFLQKYKEKTK